MSLKRKQIPTQNHKCLRGLIKRNYENSIETQKR